MLLPRGIKLIQESELEELKNQPKEQIKLPIVEEKMPEVIIEGVRATSRQLALKEKEVKDQMKLNKNARMFYTPKRKKEDGP